MNKIMIDLYAKHESMLSCPQLKEYMLHYLETNSDGNLCASYEDEYIRIRGDAR